MADQKTVKKLKEGTDPLDNGHTTAKMIVLEPVHPPRENVELLISQRPKRQRKKWPPRSPSPSEEGAGRDVFKIVVKKEHCGQKRGPNRDVEEGELEAQDECGDQDGEAEHYGEEGQAKGDGEPNESHPSPHSGNESGLEEVMQRNKKRTRKKGQDWRPLCVLPSENAFQTWKKENEEKMAPVRWVKQRMNETKAGMKRYYHCSITSCRAELVVLYPSHSEEVEVSHNRQHHVHPEYAKEWGLSAAIKQEIERLWQSGLRKPKMIQVELERRGFGGFKRNQLSNFLCRMKTMNRPIEPQLSVRDLNEWCNEHSVTQPTAALNEDVDRVYVMDHNVNVKKRQFHFVLSSKRLLKFAAQAFTVIVDASHKMKWFESSVLFLGVSDAYGQFFPVFFVVMSVETKDNYTHLLKVLKQCVEAASGSEFRPGCVLGHCDPLLTEAVEKVFPSAARRVCWQGVKREMATVLKQEDKEARNAFEKDFSALRLSCDRKQFETAAQLMLQKWRELWPASSFPEYFEEEHVKLNSGWYEGFDIASHSSNKSLSSFVNAVKQRHTLRERLPMERFLVLAVELVLEWSLGVSDSGELSQSVEPSNVLLSDTCRLQSLQKTMVELHSAIYIPAGDRTAVTVEEVEAYERKMEGEVESFDDFMGTKMSLWKVEDAGDKSDLAHMRCTCPRFFADKLCEHVLAIGSAYGLFTMPQSVWDSLPDTPDGRRKRGRPAKKKPDGVEASPLDHSTVGCYVEERMDVE